MEPTSWQALPAMRLVERSGFGLNALLDACLDVLKNGGASVLVLRVRDETFGLEVGELLQA